ncbi:unnamed protein product [Calypogeia fissa]
MGYFDSDDDTKQLVLSSYQQHGGDSFADVDNLDQCVKYVKQMLNTYGFPSNLDLYSNDPESLVYTINCIYALLQYRQRDIEFRRSVDDQRQRTMSDMARLEAKVERQDAQLASKERELSSLTVKAQKAEMAFKGQLEKLQHERDELQRIVAATKQVQVQQNHELKKKEKEYIKLQEKLNQVLTEKKKETKPGLEIMNLLQKEGRQRGTWNSKKADGDFYKMIVDAYEAKKQELMAENMDLRALLRSMQSDMRDFLNSPNAIQKTNSMNGSFDAEQQPASPRNGNTDVFDLPFHMARDQIEQSLRAKMASIKERMMQVQETQRASKPSAQAVGSVREHDVDAQLLETGSIITEQPSLMSKKVVHDRRFYSMAPTTPELGLSEEEEKFCNDSNGKRNGNGALRS